MAEHEEVIALLLFFIIIFAALLVINSTDKITGLAIAETQDNVQAQVKELAGKLDFLSSIEETSICLLIRMDELTTYSYNVDKLGTVIDVSPSSETYCDGLAVEEFVFSYVSYDSFLEHAQGNPTLDDFKATSDGTYFYVLPSKYIKQGMTVNNRGEFEFKYSAVLDQFSASEKVQFLTNPASATTQTPAGNGVPMGLIYGGAGLLFGIIVLVLLLPKLMTKPGVTDTLQIVAYIKSSMAKGYTEETIRKALVGSNWPEKEVNRAFEAIKQESAKPTEMAPKEQAKA